MPARFCKSGVPNVSGVITLKRELPHGQAIDERSILSEESLFHSTNSMGRRGTAMISYSGTLLTEVCTRVKHLGYADSKRVKIYGKEFEIVSDPFPHDGGIAAPSHRQRVTDHRGENILSLLIAWVNASTHR